MDIKKITTQIIKTGKETIAAEAGKLSKRVSEVAPIGKNTATSPIKRLEADTIQLSKEALFGKSLASKYPQKPIKISINEKESIWSRFVDSQMGSQDAFWAKNNQTGEIFYIKYAANEAKEGHIASEIQASKLYKLAGFETPEIQPVTINGKIKGLASKYIPDLKEPVDEKTIRQGFAADAWLANWDSVLYGNTFVKDGKIYKLDNGGALNYRAMGGLKPNFGEVVDELVTLVDGRNFESTSVYSAMTHQELVNSFKKVCNISDSAIKKAVDDPKLAQTLIQRKNYMKKVLVEMEKTPKQKESVAKYFTNIANNLAKQGKFDADVILTDFSKIVDSKIVKGLNSFTMPSTKELSKDLLKQIKQLEKNGVKIDKEDIINLLKEMTDAGLDIKPSKASGYQNVFFAMEEQYNKMFSSLLKLAEKTPQKEGETASAYLSKLIKAREKRIKQLDDFRIKNIKSKLKYEPEAAMPAKTVLTDSQRAQAIKELESARKSDALIDIHTIPKLSENASDQEIYEAWQRAHLGSFEFSNDSLQKSVMGVGGRYNSKHPIKTKTDFEAVLEKNYKQDFDNEPVYHWFGSNNPEAFISKNIPKNGEVYTIPQMQCCSTHKHYAEMDFGDHMSSQNIKFVIHPKSETSRAYNVGYNQEVVYPAGEKFRILDKDCIEYIDPDNGSGCMRWEIHMQEV